MIDLRSDTVTKPTQEMRRAAAEAEVGDDVYGEDPTVNRLQEMVAELLGKEDAILVTSGTQGNQLALLSLCSPGTEVILEEESHIFLYEAGAGAAFAGVQFRPIKGNRGSMDSSDVEKAIRQDNIHFPPTSLICMENTHNRAGGAVLPLEEMKAVYQVASKNNIPVHLDGARIFNASVASGVPVKDYAACATTVQICLSKGLGAPVGSVLAGPRDVIEKARRWRKRMGGGMRQAGIIAAPGVVALQTMVDRLAEDHKNARLLAEGLAELKGLMLNPKAVETNVVVMQLQSMTAANFIQKMKEKGVLVTYFGPNTVRMNTHKDVTRTDVSKVLVAARSVLAEH